MMQKSSGEVAEERRGSYVNQYLYANLILYIMKKYKWGILAPGKISAKFAVALSLLENAELYAVGSRDKERAKLFAEEFGFKKYYGSYEELAADDAVDVIYIASPHSHHYEHVMMCLRNRKAVICEKAFALTSVEVEEMIKGAQKQKVFLMEALWPPFQPMYIKTKQLLDSGAAGKLIHLNARFTFQAPYEPSDRKFNLELGGGSLLDIGIYAVIDALWFMGVPDEITAVAAFAKTGSEDSISVIFRYKDGRMANLYSSFRTDAGIGCDLLCENGNLFFSRSRDMSQCLSVEINGQESKKYSLNPAGMGYQFEASEVMKCLDEGRTESSIVPLSFSLTLMKTLDRIREVAGIVYPNEVRMQNKRTAN
jgi:predicted dehydrogenase